MENWKNKKVLVAEDEMMNFLFISILLKETGLEIKHAVNGEKAVELCSSEHFDLIFMDIKMPVMNGFEATAEIRKFNKDIVIIAQTAYAFKREECIAAGFTDYVPKPFTKAILFDLFKPYLDLQII